MTPTPSSNGHHPSQEPTPNTAEGGALSPSEQVSYEQFVALVKAAEFTPVADVDLGDYLDQVAAGHHNNVLSGNPGTPLTRAVAELFAQHRIPVAVCRQIVLTYYQQQQRGTR